MNLVLSGRYIRYGGIWDGANYRGAFWLNDGIRPPRFRTWAFYRSSFQLEYYYEGDWGVPGIEGWPIEWGEFNYGKVALPIRCVKD